MILNINDIYVPQDRLRYKFPEIINLYHYCIELSYMIIYIQLLELDDHFSEINIKLFLCMACLNLVDSFYLFDKQKLIRLAQFYLDKFWYVNLLVLEHQLKDFIVDMHQDERFYELKELGDFSKFVETKSILYIYIFICFWS